MPPAQRTVRCAGPANLLGSPLGSTSVVGAVIARSTKSGAFEGRSTSLSLIRSHATRRLSFFCSLWGRLLHVGQCLEFSTESSRRLGRSLAVFFGAVCDDIVCITDLLALWTQPLVALLSIITKEVLIRKDKHSTQLIYMLFGRRVSDLVSGLVVKSTIWPELYEVWKAKFLRRNLEKLNDPRGIAVNEIGTLLVVDSNAVYV